MTPQRTQRPDYAVDTTRQKFTGYQKDTETGLDFAQARMYGGTSGRFTSPDPLMASAKITNPQTFNRYIYVGNNPLRFTDPSGLEWGAYESGGRQYLHWFDGKAGKFGGHRYHTYTGSLTIKDTSRGWITLHANDRGYDPAVPPIGGGTRQSERDNADWLTIRNATGGLMCSGSAGFVCPGDNNASEFKDAKMGADAVQYAFMVKSLLKMGLSLAAIAAIIKSDPQDVAKIAISVAKGFKNLECTQCATALKEAFKAKGISGEVITLSAPDAPLGAIWSNAAKGAISENGVHQGVRVGEMVFDNIHQSGIAYAEWIKDFEVGRGAITASSVPF